MAIFRSTFENIMRNNVVEFKWIRRIPKTGAAITRRALGTNNHTLLNSEFGFKVLNFKPPTQPNPINQTAHNLVTYWDIFRQEYRNSSCESLHMVNIIPVTNPDEINKWWIYFRDTIRDMTPDQKLQFMDK